MLRIALAVLAAAHLVVVLSPWRLFMPGPGLDSAWQQVVAHAAASGWQWGTDIAFTYGPLGYLRSPPYDDALLGSVLAWNTFLTVALVVGVVALLREAPVLPGIVLYTTIALATGRANQGALMMLPPLAALLQFRARRTPAIVPALLLCASGVYAVVYASMLVLGSATAALMDASRISRRRFPAFTLLFVSTVFGAFLLAGQQPASFPGFLRSVVEMIAGYGDAMGIDGNGVETLAFLAASATAMTLLIAAERARLSDPRQRADVWLLVLALAACWFVAWKGGFVRHDRHSVGAWRMLAGQVAAYAALRWPDLSPRARPAFVAVALLACWGAVYGGSGRVAPAEIWRQATNTLVDAPLRSLAQARAALEDPPAWRVGQRRAAEAAHAALRKAFPDLRASGTVDLVGLDQGAVLAHPVDYRPQPVFQAFAAYTPWLVALNRAHLRSDRAAATLFLSSATIDNRYPLSDLGLAVAEVLTRYRPVGLAGDYVRWQLRDTAADVPIVEERGLEAPFGEWIPVRAGEAPIVLRADVRASALGQVARTALRLPAVLVSVRLANGLVRTHRIVPAIAADGFLLSPYAETAAVLAAQAAGQPDVASGNRVVAFRIDAESPSLRSFFADGIGIRLARLDAPASHDAATSALARHFRMMENVTRLAQSVAGRSQVVEPRGTLLFAHAPASPEITLPAAGTLRARYGIFDGAWAGDNRTDGVCFRIRRIGADGGTSILHERCLAPLEQAADRGDQEATIRIDAKPPVRLVFETDCRGSCSWDWSYWKDIDVAP